MADDAPPAFDAAKFIADLRLGDPQALEQAYKLTFGHDMGRLVLGHFMTECGVGTQLDINCTDGELRYLVGQHNAAVALAARAGFDPPSIIARIMTDNLEGNTDDRRYNHHDDADTGREFADYIPGDDVEF